MADPGDGSGVRTPIRPDACLRLKFLHRQDRISLFNWLIFFSETRVVFCHETKLQGYSSGNCFRVPSYDMFASASKAVFPAPTATRAHRLRNTWSSLLLSWSQKNVKQSFLDQSLKPQGFLDPPLR